jgi:hypothetical protein
VNAIATQSEPLITLKNRLSLAQAGKQIGKSPSALFRWHRDGCRGIRLECIRLGRSLYTSEPALEVFARDLARAAQPGDEFI